MEKIKASSLFVIIVISLLTSCDTSFDLVFSKNADLGGYQLSEFPDELIGSYKSEIDDEIIIVEQKIVKSEKDPSSFLYFEITLSDSISLFKHNGFFTLRFGPVISDICDIIAIIPIDSTGYGVKILTTEDEVSLYKYTEGIPVFALSNTDDSLSVSKKYLANPDSVQFSRMVLDNEKFFIKKYRKLSFNSEK